MTIKKTTPVEAVKVTTKFELDMEWRAFPSNTNIKSDDEELIIQWVKLLKEYSQKLSNNWNDWCNVEVDMVMEIVEEFNLTLLDEDIINEYWANHPQYGFMDIIKNYKVFMYDEHAVKFNTEIQK